jgi:hypothetical protein
MLKDYCSSDFTESVEVRITFRRHFLTSNTLPQVLGCIVVLLTNEAKNPLKSDTGTYKELQNVRRESLWRDKLSCINQSKNSDRQRYAYAKCVLTYEAV